MPFKRTRPSKSPSGKTYRYKSPSGKKFTAKQVRLYYATGGTFNKTNIHHVKRKAGG